MDSAIKACEEGSSVCEAARTFNVPRTSLRRRLAGIPAGKRGPKRKFTVEEEKFLVDLMLKAADIGIPFDKRLLEKLVIKMCMAKGKDCAFIVTALLEFLRLNFVVSF